MTEPVDSERPNIQSGDEYSAIAELSRLVQSIIEEMIDEKLRQAPEWFTSEINNIKTSFTNMDNKFTSLQKEEVASLKTEVSSLKTEVASLKTDMDDKFTSLETGLYNNVALVDSRFAKM